MGRVSISSAGWFEPLNLVELSNSALQVCLSKLENADAILVGLEKTACLIDRCTVYEVLYANGDSAASKNLEKSILQLYTAILKFLAKLSRC